MNSFRDFVIFPESGKQYNFALELLMSLEI